MIQQEIGEIAEEEEEDADESTLQGPRKKTGNNKQTKNFPLYTILLLFFFK